MNKDEDWQADSKLKQKLENPRLFVEPAFNSLTYSLFRYYTVYFTHNESELVVNKIKITHWQTRI